MVCFATWWYIINKSLHVLTDSTTCSPHRSTRKRWWITIRHLVCPPVPPVPTSHRGGASLHGRILLWGWQTGWEYSRLISFFYKSVFFFVVDYVILIQQRSRFCLFLSIKQSFTDLYIINLVEYHQKWHSQSNEAKEITCFKSQLIITVFCVFVCYCWSLERKLTKKLPSEQWFLTFLLKAFPYI